jgi:hypothetical protein
VRAIFVFLCCASPSIDRHHHSHVNDSRNSERITILLPSKAIMPCAMHKNVSIPPIDSLLRSVTTNCHLNFFLPSSRSLSWLLFFIEV